MPKTAKIAGFTPSGTVHKSTVLPKATSKSHAELGLSDKDVLAMYESMQLQRRFEERAAQMYQKGKFGGFLHLYIGQEAVSTGTVQALNHNDDLITAYRDHGHALARGATPNECMAELFGKATGLSKGKGGSMHYFKVEKHMWGGHAIVGAHIPLAAGMAMANKYQQNGRVVVCFFGDGAIDQGSVNETFNMAQLWKLPVIFVVENNGYSMGTAVERHSATELYKRACGFDMKSDVVNGMDAFSVYEKFKEVAADVRKNFNPWFLEVRTYRYRGHSMSDPQNYRTKEELEDFKGFDPIERLKSYVLSKKLAIQKELDAIDERIESQVLDSIDFAEQSPFPDLSELYKDVYVEDDFPWTT